MSLSPWLQAVKNNPHDYDSWFDYLRLMEIDGDIDQVRDIFERAISNIPPSKVSKNVQQFTY